MREPKQEFISRDTDSDKESYELLKMKSMFLEAVMNSSADGILVVDPQGKKVLQNKKTIELWKIDPDVASDPDGSRQVAHVMHMTKNPEQFFAEIEYQKTHPMETINDQLELIDGTVLDRHSAPVIGEDGKIYGRIYHFHDVTSFRKAQEKITGLLKEKEIILREVHHRVKNYMSTVIGLLTFQAMTMKDESAASALLDAENRIRSMISLYNKLYVSNEFSTTSTANYFPSLIDEIISNFPNKASVEVEKKIEEFALEASTIQTMSIIMNELLTNSMKYAFDGKHHSKITVSISKENGNVNLHVEDNGKGFPEDINPVHSTNGFGLFLVKGLVEQLSGELHFNEKNGARFSISFPAL